MEELQRILETILNEDLEQIILSNTREPSVASKAKIRPVLIGDELKFQETRYQGTKVFHENYDKEAMISRIRQELSELFRQGELRGKTLEGTVLVSKKGKMTVKSRKRNPGAANAVFTQAGQNGETARGKTAVADNHIAGLSHNRTKQYILPEGEPVDFLVRLGVQTPDGRIKKNRYDKFRQINRYLEFIEDVLEELPKDRTIQMVDFGCGKSYLTFAAYYFLHVKQGRNLNVIGLDLKEDVIRNCNALARELGYEGLRFEQGDISAYQGEGADIVISLHACDLATDYALEKAVKWGAKVIMAVPCCQHELNRQIKNDMLKPVLKYGILKERMAALITDAVRADILERQGYEVQILEFIDMEHTPKNLLLRAVKHRKMKGGRQDEALREMEEFLQIRPTLERLLPRQECYKG
ncbi:MAG: SAM-dependent methyltransferase [Lachnospiraceae bacterium]|nr:SAM-dependent methyltransferase [Lachnospiraceae bacterium]